MSEALRKATVAAIERRMRMKLAAYYSLAGQVAEINKKRALDSIEVKVFPNAIPDELLNARQYQRKYPTTVEIIRATAQQFGIPAHDIMSQRRTNDIVHARHAIYWLCRECTPMSLLQIGHQLGKRDHTTILNGIKKTDIRIAERNPIKVVNNCLYLREELLGPKPAPFWGS